MNYRKVFNLILLYFFRRIDFLSRSIYVLVLAIVRELGALGFSDGVTELATEIKKNPTIQGWKYWGIRVLEILLIGGDWFILSVLFFLIAGIGFLRYKAKDLPVLKHHFNSQLRTITDLIESFQSVTAIKLLNKIQQDIEDSQLAESDRNELMAWSYHLIGICRIDERNVQQSFLNHIKSYQLKPQDAKYKERACASYCFTDQKDKALSLANEIIDHDGLNERAYAIKLILDPTFKLSSIPTPVRSGFTFKRMYANYLLGLKDGNEGKAREIINDDLQTHFIPPIIDFTNIDYCDLLGRFAFYLGTNTQPNTFASVKEDYQGNEMIKYSNQILSAVFSKVVDTELYKNYKAFKLTAFYYFQTEYLLYGKSNAVTQMVDLYHAHLSKEPFSNQLASAILICLNQLRRDEDVLEFAATLDRTDCFIYLMEFQALNGMGKKDEAKNAFLKYLENLELVSDIEVNNLLSFGDFLLQQKENVSEYYKSTIEQKTFENDIQKALLFCYYHRYVSEQYESIRDKINPVVEAYSELRYELRYCVLIVLLATKDFERALSLIEKYHDWKTEQPPLSIYTECLLALRNDSTKLLEALKFRRVNYPEEYLFIQEISIYELTENAAEILDISRIAKTAYPSNPNFQFYFIYSLYKLNEDEQLDKFLNDDLLKAQFNWKQKYILARICIEKNKKALGLELFYQETIKNINSPVLKQNYFTLTTTIADRDDIPWPEVVAFGTTVRVQIGDEQLLLDINEKTNAENWVVKNLLGRGINASIRIEDPVTHKKIDVTILQILDKYSGLAARIADEVGKSNFTGMGIRAVKFENSNADSIKKALMEAFGEAGDNDKIRKDEAFKKYYNHQLSFTELVRSISRDEVFEIFSHLTSKESKGFLVIPIRDFNGVKINDDTEFVIDFTSLPVLMKLAKDFPEMIKHKFVISQFAIEFIENLLAEAKTMQEDGMVVSITSSGVRPTLYPPGYKEYRVSTLQNMLEWIQIHCETRMSKDKLDMMLQKPDLVRENDLYHNYFIDTAFISHGRTLISDDRIHNINFRNHYLTISLEYYLQYFYQDSFRKFILPILIQNHYVGLKLDAETIMTEFKRPFYGGVNTFHYCLENLPFSVNHDLSVFNESLDFIKAIYIENMPLKFKKETSQKVLTNALKNYPNLLNLRKNLINEINSRFALLPLQLIEVLDDFTVAFDILNR